MKDILKEFTEKRKNRKAKNKPVRIATTLGALAVAAFVMWGLMVPGIAMGDDDNQADEVTIELADESETGEVIEETDLEDTSEYTGGGMGDESDSSDAANTSDNSNDSDNQDTLAGGDASVDNTNSSGNENQKTTDASANTNGNAQETEDNSADSNGSSQENNNQNSIDSSNSDSSDTIDQNSEKAFEEVISEEASAAYSMNEIALTSEEEINLVSEEDVDSDSTEDYKVKVSLTKNQNEEKNGNQLTVSVFSSVANSQVDKNEKIYIDLGKLPDGVSLSGFENGEFHWKSTSEDLEITLYLKTKENGESYIEFEQPAGATINFDLNFNSTNGTMPKETEITVKPRVDGEQDKVEIDPAEGLTLKWTGVHSWKNVTKKVDSEKIKAIKNEDNFVQLQGNLKYTIQAQPDNSADNGVIWTDHVIITDTLNLPNGITFPNGTNYTYDQTKKAIVDSSNNVLLSFSNESLPNDATIQIEEQTNSIIKYIITLPNSNKDSGSTLPIKEMDPVNLECTLDVSKLVVGKATVSNDDKIVNNVEIETFPCQEYTHHESSDSATSYPELKEDFNITKKSNYQEWSQVLPNTEIEYTITVENTGGLPLSAEDEDENEVYITDTLPKYLTLTVEQKNALNQAGATINESDGSITIKWPAGVIQPGSKKTITFKANVKSAEEMRKLSAGNDTVITNIAEYSGKKAESHIKYKKPNVTISKASTTSKTVSTGDIITYKIEINNSENIISEAQTIEDELSNALTFLKMVDKDGNELDTTSGSFEADSTAISGKHTVQMNKDGQKITWSLGILEANEKVTLYYLCKIDADKMSQEELNSGSIKNTATNKTTGDKDSEDKKVTNPITIDKKVNDGDGGGTYTNETELNYSISIKNAEGDKASLKTDIILKDDLAAGLIPKYDLYTLKDGVTFGNSALNESYLNRKYDFSFKQYLTDSSYSGTEYDGPYYTLIGSDVVRVSRTKISNPGDGYSYAAKLEWFIGEMKPGATVTKKYTVELSMTETQINSGEKIAYKNTAEVNGTKDSVTIYGGDGKSKITLKKQVKGKIKYNTLTSEQKESIKFKITCKNGDEIISASEINLNNENFTKEDNETAKYIWNDLEPGYTYIIQEIGYELPDLKVKTTITNESGNVEPSIDQNNRIWTVTLPTEPVDVEVKFKNEYDTTEAPTVDIQKSVYEIQNYTDTWNHTSITSKSLFDISDSSSQENAGTYVIYNISIINTGNKDITIKDLVDELPKGMKYIGMCNNLYNQQVSQFISDDSNGITIDGNMHRWINIESSNLQTYIKVNRTEYDKDTQKVNFKIYKNKVDKGATLLAGKAISFFIMCKVDPSVEFDKPLENTAKLYVSSDVEYKDYDTIEMKGTKNDSIQNNGDSRDAGVTEDGQRVISSSVTVKPTKAVIPGIRKTAVSYIESGTSVEKSIDDKTQNIYPVSTVKWEIELLNDGMSAIDAYKISDTVDPDFYILTRQEAENLKNKNIDTSKCFLLEVQDANGEITKSKDLSVYVWSQTSTGKERSITLNIKSEDALSIPAGGKAVFTVYTKNDIYKNTIYNNEATFTPIVNQTTGGISVDYNSVTNGEPIKDSTGTYTGVKASDSVYAMGNYGSFSWKQVEESGKSSNKAVGYDKQNNYIVIENNTAENGDLKKVVYTNNIENVSDYPFSNMVIIDVMPYVGDKGVLNQENRDSEFAITYAKNLKLVVKDSSGNVSNELTEGSDYTVKYSEKVGFTQDEWKGITGTDWHDEKTSEDKTFYILMSNSFTLQAGYTLSIQYEGEIEAGARPGQIAWNSFGYGYTASENRLTAEPPKVGVMIKKQSTIHKEVVDSEGTSQPYNVNKMFTFTIYKGENASGDSLGSFQICQGGFVNLHELKDFNTGNPITLESGKTYTVTETNTNGCDFAGVGKEGETLSGENKYTFTYSTGEAITIVFKNKMSSYVLPSTGGVGVARYFAGGALLMSITALLYGCLWRRRRERRFR